MIKDYNIAWNRKRKFLPCYTMLGMINDTSEANGGPVLAANPMATSELVGLSIAQAGDEVYTFWPLPWDLDRSEPLRFRIWFTHSTADADTPDWVVSYQAIADSVAITDGKAGADENVAFAATAVTATAHALEILDWEESISDTLIETTDHALLIALECNGLGSAGADEINVLGLEIEYTVGACLDSSHQDKTRNAPVGP